MSLEALDTVAALLTVVIVAGTATAALIQLRHLRTGNQINSMLTIGANFNDAAYNDAEDLIRRHLERLPEACSEVTNPQSMAHF